MPPKRGKAAAMRGRSRPGLTLVAESPARPLEAFLTRKGEANGASPLAQRKTVARKGPSKTTKEVDRASSSRAMSNGKGKRKAVQQDDDAHLDAAPSSQIAAGAMSTLWVDERSTIPRAELAIHKKKIDQVAGWLQAALDGKPVVQKYRRILVLHGPAGAGKSALIHSLGRADALNYSIIDWSADALSSFGASSWDQGAAESSYMGSQGMGMASSAGAESRFGGFLSQAGKYQSLVMEDAESDATGARSTNQPVGDATSQSVEATSNSSGRKVLLLDDLPNLFHLPTRAAFHQALEQFLRAEERVPLVICITESDPRLDDYGGNHAIGNWKDRGDDTLSVRTALSESLRNNVAVFLVPFNSVAITILRKALAAILEHASLQHTECIPPPTSARGKELIEAIASTSNGDLRSAINNLQFALAHVKVSRNGIAQGTKRNARGDPKANRQDASLRESISAAAGREASLAVFHALGRILYNKREGDEPEEGETKKRKADKTTMPKPEKDTLQEGEATRKKQGAGAPQEDKATESKPADDKDQDGKVTPWKPEVEEEVIPTLPAHMTHLDRRESKVDVESLWRSMPLDASTLQAFVHQNYTPFCNTIDQCVSLMDGLSDAEALKPAYEGWSHAGVTQYYSFLVSTHSALLALPSPVTRRKEQRLGGVALFGVQRRQREVANALAEVSSALVSYAQADTETDDPDAITVDSASVLTDCRGDRLACEVLPYLAKCRPKDKPAAIASLADMPWTTSTNSSGLDIDGENGGEMDLDATQYEYVSAGALAPLLSRWLEHGKHGSVRADQSAATDDEAMDSLDDEIEDSD